MYLRLFQPVIYLTSRFKPPVRVVVTSEIRLPRVYSAEFERKGFVRGTIESNDPQTPITANSVNRPSINADQFIYALLNTIQIRRDF